VSTPQIGVHLADHSFFPIFKTEAPGRKRVVLSTARTDQECVDIVLYRRDPGFVEGEERLGNVLLCDLAPGTPDESDIELVLDLHADGRIEATALDRRSGNSRTVAIDRKDAVPEASMPETAEDDQFTAGTVEMLYDDEELPAEPHRSSAGKTLGWLLFLLLLLAGLLLWWYLSRPATVAPGAPSPTVAPTVEPAAPSVSAPESVEPTEPAEPAAPPSPSSPQDYRIIWGDTLWDISKTFYGTPWRFRDIADQNAIKNPDKIYADDHIKIPGE